MAKPTSIAVIQCAIKIFGHMCANGRCSKIISTSSVFVDLKKSSLSISMKFISSYLRSINSQTKKNDRNQFLISGVMTKEYSLIETTNVERSKRIQSN